MTALRGRALHPDDVLILDGAEVSAWPRPLVDDLDLRRGAVELDRRLEGRALREDDIGDHRMPPCSLSCARAALR